MSFELKNFVNMDNHQPEFLKRAAELQNQPTEGQVNTGTTPGTPNVVTPPNTEPQVLPGTPMAQNPNVPQGTHPATAPANTPADTSADPNPAVPNSDITEENTFSLLGQALVLNGTFPDDFNPETINDAGSFVDAIKENIKNNINQGLQAIEEKYANYINLFHNLDQGIDLETAREIQILDSVVNLDYSADTPETLQAKESIIRTRYALENSNVDADFIEAFIKETHLNNTFETKFKDSLTALSQYKDKLANDAKLAYEARIKKEQETVSKKANDFIKSMKQVASTTLSSLDENSRNNLFKALEEKTEKIIVTDSSGKAQEQETTLRIKFIDQVLNNPEVQLMALLAYMNNYGVNKTPSNKSMATVLEILNKSIDPKNQKPKPQGAQEAPWKTGPAQVLRF